MPEARVRLLHRDQFGLEYEKSLALTQQPGDHDIYALGSTDPSLTKPKIGWREVWRLGKSV